MLLPSRKKLLSLFFPMLFTITITVLNTSAYAAIKYNFFDTFDPRAPTAKKQLEEIDRDYERITGKSAHIKSDPAETFDDFSLACYRSSCKIWADVDINMQRLYLYINGVLTYTWKVSTGRFGYETPSMNTHPDGRMYEKHTSPKYPEGDYHGLGNMPFSVFVDGAYAIHGTTKGSWWRLGTTASHGCIRLHPDNAEMFYVLVRRSGIRNVWISIN